MLPIEHGSRSICCLDVVLLFLLTSDILKRNSSAAPVFIKHGASKLLSAPFLSYISIHALLPQPRPIPFSPPLAITSAAASVVALSAALCTGHAHLLLDQ